MTYNVFSGTLNRTQSINLTVCSIPVLVNALRQLFSFGYWSSTATGVPIQRGENSVYWHTQTFGICWPFSRLTEAIPSFTNLLDNSWIRQFADWTDCRLDSSQMPLAVAVLVVITWIFGHKTAGGICELCSPRPVECASWLVHELTSPWDVYCLGHELSICELSSYNSNCCLARPKCQSCPGAKSCHISITLFCCLAFPIGICFSSQTMLEGKNDSLTWWKRCMGEKGWEPLKY